MHPERLRIGQCACSRIVVNEWASAYSREENSTFLIVKPPLSSYDCRMIDEEWRPCTSFPDYWVSSYGRVKSTHRLLEGAIPKGAKSRMVSLGRPSRRVTIARLVAEAFAGPRPHRAVVVTKNGDMNDLRASNIRWGKKVVPPRYADRDPVAEFWKKVDKSGDCWVWTSGKNQGGYGIFHVNGGVVMATHYSLLLAMGEKPKAPFYALHRCDNPPCVNPAHLFVGTKLDNKRDQMAKGRLPAAPKKFGESNTAAKLTEHDVREIRASPMSGRALAKAYGVSPMLISYIRRNIIWRHVG